MNKTKESDLLKKIQISRFQMLDIMKGKTRYSLGDIIIEQDTKDKHLINIYFRGL